MNLNYPNLSAFHFPTAYISDFKSLSNRKSTLQTSISLSSLLKYLNIRERGDIDEIPTDDVKGAS